MRTIEIPEIDELSVPEKILLVEDIWDSISINESDVPIPESHLNELDKRAKNYKSPPGNLLSLEELQARLRRIK